MRFVGVDGCKGGWLVASSDGSGESVSFDMVVDLAPVIDLAAQGQARVLIDMPIGLPEDERPRACEVQARRLLGSPRASSVFPAPRRRALESASYAEACELNLAACGKRLSQQSFAILHRIKYLDGLMTPELQAWVREAHPEVTFALLSDSRHGLVYGKRSGAGRVQRLDLLARHLPQFQPARVRERLGRRLTGLDDIVDAAACLLTAQRVGAGRAFVLPEDRIEHDARGLRMEIVA